MDDSLGMGGLEHLTQLSEQPPGAFGSKPAIPYEQGVQGHAADVLHNDARSLGIVERGIVERYSVRVLKTSHEQRFALKALAKFGIGRQVVVHDFHDNLPPEIELAGQIDHSHATFTEHLERFVPAQKNATHHREVHPLENFESNPPCKSSSEFCRLLRIG
jgi:hypothetical protein